MGARGPMKKPAILKILEGSSGKINKEVKPKPIPPQCPSWLSPFAQEEWNRTAPMIEKLGLLTEVDAAAFEAYCQVYANWKEATLIIRQEGLTFVTPNGYVQQRPEVAIANTAAKLMRGFIHEFGLSPSARANMAVDSGRDADDGADFFSKAQ